MISMSVRLGDVAGDQNSLKILSMAISTYRYNAYISRLKPACSCVDDRQSLELQFGGSGSMSLDKRNSVLAYQYCQSSSKLNARVLLSLLVLGYA